MTRLVLFAVALVLGAAPARAFDFGGLFGGEEEERTPEEHPWAEGVGPATEEEIRALGVSEDLAEMLRNRTAGVPSLLRVPAEETPIGLTWPIASTESVALVRDLREELAGRGFSFFIARQRFGTGPDEVGLVEAPDVNATLARLGTPGAPSGLTTEDLTDRLSSWVAVTPWKLLGAGPDWIEIEFQPPPAREDVERILDEASRLAPDAVREAPERREALANQLERTGRLLLWWE